MSLGKDLIKSAHEALAIAKGELEPACVYIPEEINVAAIRRKTKLTQLDFAARFGLSVATLREWEQKKRHPDRTAITLLLVIDKEPEAVQRALNKT